MATKKGKQKKKIYRNWTVFLLKEDYVPTEKHLSISAEQLKTHAVTIPNAISATLYTKQVAEVEPAWVKQFSGVASPPVSVKSKSAAALLVIQTSKATFALAFGFGRSLLNTESWEEEFGLKVVLNNIGDEGIKQIQLSAFDSLLQNKQAQSVRSARIDEFGLDVEQDVIRSLTGTPSDGELGRLFGGRDSLRISTETSINDLPKLLDRLFEDSKKETYLTTFSWIGRMKEVRDKKLKETLNEKLLEKIVSKDFERLWMAPPTYQEWEAGRMFVVAKTDEDHDDLRMHEIVEEWDTNGFLDGLEIGDLKSHHVLAIDDSRYGVERWTIYKTIYCEIDHDNGTYILNSGTWYRIRASYLQEVNKTFIEFPRTELDLPDYNDPSEEAYNIRVSQERSDVCLMDQKFVELNARGLTKVELCDLLTPEKQIIHIKRYSGSSTLSHLFAQGIVSAELFLNVPEFRAKVNTYVSSNCKLADPAAPINPQQYEIIYGIVSKSNKEINLPFFSKVMLRNARTVLQNLNYRVSLCKIPNGYTPPPPEKPKES
jgi:uncharacterized protein (TIGR04141 family)